MESDASIWADGILTQFLAGAAGPIQNDEYLATLRGDFDSKTGKCRIPMDGVGLRGRKCVDGAFGQLCAWHRRRALAGVLPCPLIGSARDETAGTSVIPDPSRCKQIQRVMNRGQRPSISGKQLSENARGEGVPARAVTVDTMSLRPRLNCTPFDSAGSLWKCSDTEVKLSCGA